MQFELGEISMQIIMCMSDSMTRNNVLHMIHTFQFYCNLLKRVILIACKNQIFICTLFKESIC